MLNLKNLPWIEIEDISCHDLIYPLLPENPTILEAGAGVGEDTIRFAKRYPYSTIYCFEPYKDLYDKLLENLEKVENKSIYTYPFALSDTTEIKTFYLSRAVPQASSLLEDNYRNIEIPQKILDSVGLKKDEVTYNDKPTHVQCITVDDWKNISIVPIKPIDFIWFDLEGQELTVLQNSNSILKDVKVIYTEVNFLEFRKGTVLFEDIYNFMVGKGFQLLHIWGNPEWQGNAIWIREI